MAKLRFATVLAGVSAYGSTGYGELSCTDLDLLQQETLWSPNDRNLVQRLIESVIWGTLDTLNVPRFPLPVEAYAAAIALTVSPVNWMVAASFFSGHQLADDLANDGHERISSRQLFAMVLQCAEDKDKYNAKISKAATAK